MTNETTMSQLEERLVVMKSVISFLIAHLVDEGLINLEAMHTDIKNISTISGFHSKAMSDVDSIFELAGLALSAIERTRQSIPDQGV